MGLIGWKMMATGSEKGEMRVGRGAVTGKHKRWKKWEHVEIYTACYLCFKIMFWVSLRASLRIKSSSISCYGSLLKDQNTGVFFLLSMKYKNLRILLLRGSL